jgi:hypothetical protein
MGKGSHGDFPVLLVHRDYQGVDSVYLKVRLGLPAISFLDSFLNLYNSDERGQVHEIL